MTPTVAVLAALVAAAPAAAQAQKAAAAPVWRVDPRASSILFRSSYAGTNVAGRFMRWTAAIVFDPARPESGKVTVDVDLASASTGDGQVDPQLPTADWLAAAAAPRARFSTQSIAAAGPGRYLARGTLTLKGVSVPVTLPFTLTIRGASAVMAGTAQLDRRALKLGLGSDAAGQWVPFAVPVEVRVAATRGG